MQEEIFCPFCDDFTEHVTVKQGREHLVRCEVCKTVHLIQQERTKLSSLRVIVSKERTSQRYQIDIPADEILTVGGELLVDDGVNDVILCQITSLEPAKEGRRMKRSRAEEIKTVWARAIDEVIVKVSIYHKGTTTSHIIPTWGEDTFYAGEVRTVDGIRFEVNNIKLRSGKSPNKAMARDILRIWGAKF